jgi:hypothetical protein
MRQRHALLFLLFLLPAPAGCARQPGLFNEQNARAHIGMLAGTIGSRPVGTPANARARAYIIDQLRIFGFDVRVQETDARRAALGRTARVSNIIAVRPGRRSEAVALVSHYDSVGAGPGAADDGLGVGVSLEAARVLAARTDPNWTLMVLITDGEEAGLMGAAALMTDRDVTNRLQTYVNLEAIGSAGPPNLFEAGPGNGWLVARWARVAPHPRGASFAVEIYRRLPNDTDFSILKLQDIPGLNFAAVDDTYAYHTPRDTPERLSPRTVRAAGEQIVALVSALDAVDITRRSRSDYTFFDVGRTAALSYGPLVGWTINALALLLGVVAWVKATAAAIRLEGVLRWLLTYVWVFVGSAAVVLAMVGATWALRAAREVYHPWYARPERLFLLVLALGLTVGWGSVRVGRWLPQRARGIRHPVLVWSIALPSWIALGTASLWFAPGAAYLWLLPLLAAGVLLTIIPVSNSIAVRAASVAVLAVAGTLWLRDTVDFLRFVVTLFGRLPVVTPVFVYGALMAAAGVMVVPPVVATIAAARPLLRPPLMTACCLIAVAVTAGFAYVAPAYTYEQPLRRQVRVLHEPDGAAVWEVASVEPGLDLGVDAPAGWTVQTPGVGATVGGVPVRRLPHPFVFRASGAALGPAPLTIASLTIEPVAAGSELAVVVIPLAPGLTVSFVLPAGLQPARSSLPGILRQGRWTATYIAPPPDGVAFRASFNQADAARLRDFRVVAIAEGGEGWPLPSWLPQERTVWAADAAWVVAPGAPPLASAAALR